MFETEGDTLANTFDSDYGNYSDGFRKAFHHEAISYIRRKDKEYVSIKSPCLSTLLTGTPQQVRSLIKDAENGLFSRFLFYYLNAKSDGHDVFDCGSGIALDDYFKQLGEEFHSLHKLLQPMHPSVLNSHHPRCSDSTPTSPPSRPANLTVMLNTSLHPSVASVYPPSG